MEFFLFCKLFVVSGLIEKVMIVDFLMNNVLSISVVRVKFLVFCLRFCMVGVGFLEEFGGYNLFYVRCDIVFD